MMKQVTLDEAIALAQAEPPKSFSAQVLEKNHENAEDMKREKAPLRERVYQAMGHGRPMTLAQIAAAAHGPEASVSARIRELRADGHVIHKWQEGKSPVFLYRLLPLQECS